MSGRLQSFTAVIRNFTRNVSTSKVSGSEIRPVSQASVPLILDEKFDNARNVVAAREAWVETLDANTSEVGMIALHPDVFAVCPRMDIIHENVVWQRKYKMVSKAHTKTKPEVRGGGRKPWPQKGTGRARHSSIRSPLWVGGGVTHGPRAFTTQFYMLPIVTRIHGLTSTLSAKFAQDDLKIVESLQMASDEPGYIEKLCENRQWGPSVLFVDDTDLMPRNITIATDTMQHMNLMPVYGLNVYSMLKHSTLVLTVDAVRRLEERILYHLNRPDLYKENATPFNKQN
ncbi:39S ribosomal protein L4, mitochondrial-like isoform X1 [Penaeus chinensis]|uniref:39S ribosomal protein L4, mitochondrial-like isoform X1 n=1 Tax=Penaeus chinensis TaxID=139456 RepID=UPI001FB79CBF|nr:39S ribosomal protein L4, mitochondrial-like isoform X1 [Penaeus chinensis]